jgi:hypothetical protein
MPKTRGAASGAMPTPRITDPHSRRDSLLYAQRESQPPLGIRCEIRRPIQARKSPTVHTDYYRLDAAGDLMTIIWPRSEPPLDDVIRPRRRSNITDVVEVDQQFLFGKQVRLVRHLPDVERRDVHQVRMRGLLLHQTAYPCLDVGLRASC